MAPARTNSAWGIILSLGLALTLACASGTESRPRQGCLPPEATATILRQLTSRGLGNITPEDMASGTWQVLSDAWPPLETSSEEPKCKESRTFLSNQRIIGNRGECLFEATFEALPKGEGQLICKVKLARLYILYSTNSRKAAMEAVESWIQGVTSDLSLSEAIPPANLSTGDSPSSWYYEWNEADATISANFTVDRGDAGWEGRGHISIWPKIQ